LEQGLGGSQGLTGLTAASSGSGVIPRCADELFTVLEAAADAHHRPAAAADDMGGRLVDYSVHCQFMQIYNEKVRNAIIASISVHRCAYFPRVLGPLYAAPLTL